MFSISLLSRNSPEILQFEYVSIGAAAEMREAWTALDGPDRYSESPAQFWIDQFEKALVLEERNITEPGESEIAAGLRKLWNRAKTGTFPVPVADYRKMNDLLSNLVYVNEKGMFERSEANTRKSHLVAGTATAYFIISLLVAFLLADGLANRLSQPVKSIAEELHRRPEIGKELNLSEPNTLEFLVLNDELTRLWDRVREMEKINVIELIQEKTKLATVLESVEDALLVVNTKGRVSHCNECLLRLVGLPREKIMNQHWQDLPTTNDNYLRLRSLVREEMPDMQEIELKLDNKLRLYSARARNITDPDGLSIAILYLLHDSTEEKQRERFRSDFIDLISHELKTPLQSLGTASDLLAAKKEQLPPPERTLVEIVSEEVDRIRAVASEMFQVTQSHSNVLKLKLKKLSLYEFLANSIKPFRMLAKDKGLTITLNQEPELVWANIDPVKFPWVISNLLSNAIRFTPEGGHIDLSFTEVGETIEIHVKDEGPGISSDDQIRIFEPFFQSQEAIYSDQHGLFGVGLTIAKEVVEAHGGRLEYTPGIPRGSDFKIVLPRPYVLKA